MWFLFKLEEAQEAREKKGKARKTQGWKLFNVEGNSARFFRYLNLGVPNSGLSVSRRGFIIKSNKMSTLSMKQENRQQVNFCSGYNEKALPRTVPPV